MIEETSDGVIITVHVQPKAAETEYVGIHGDAFKFRVAAPPVGGEANSTLCRYLADLFACPKSAVSLCSGQATRKKRIKLMGVTVQAVRSKWNLEYV